MNDIKPQRPNMHRMQLTEGEFVQIGSLTGARLSGFVVASGNDRIRLILHSLGGATDPCLNMDAIVPWSSVALVLIDHGQPTSCDCAKRINGEDR